MENSFKSFSISFSFFMDGSMYMCFIHYLSLNHLNAKVFALLLIALYHP
jgi:hypothetical protein